MGNIEDGGKTRGGEEGGGRGNTVLKGNEELLKHEAGVKGRDAQHGSVGGKEGRARETGAEERMMGT